MTRTLTEDFLLLVLDDESGRWLLGAQQRHAAVAGATLVQLTLDGALELAETDGEVGRGRFRHTGTAPVDPRLADVLDRAHGRTPKVVIASLTGGLTSAAQQREQKLVARMVAGGLLTERRTRLLAVFPSTRLLPSDPSAAAGVRGELLAVLQAAASPDARTGALISLLYSTGMLTKVFPGEERRALTARA